jgi:hypothetical protein
LGLTIVLVVLSGFSQTKLEEFAVMNIFPKQSCIKYELRSYYSHVLTRAIDLETLNVPDCLADLVAQYLEGYFEAPINVDDYVEVDLVQDQNWFIARVTRPIGKSGEVRVASSELDVVFAMDIMGGRVAPLLTFTTGEIPQDREEGEDGNEEPELVEDFDDDFFQDHSDAFQYAGDHYHEMDDSDFIDIEDDESSFNFLFY